MALKRATKKYFSLPYKWRLLLPTIGLTWIIIASLAFYQYNREKRVRSFAIYNALDLISTNIVEAYISYEDQDKLMQFLDFVNDYYTNTRYDLLRVSVYKYDGTLIYARGNPVPFTFSKYEKLTSDNIDSDLREELQIDAEVPDDDVFYYSTVKSNDGMIYVLSAMPYTPDLVDLVGRADFIWIIVLVLMVVSSIVVYLYVNHFSKSVKLLTRFADDVSNDRNLSGYESFPDDEFGRISRQIVTIYKQKLESMEESEKEHKVALHAIEEKARLKREMTNNVSHELKTPIGIICGYIDTILTNEDMDAEQMRYFISRIQPNVERLVKLMGDISTVTRLEDGVAAISLTEVDFHDLVFSIADDVRGSGVLNGMKFEYDIPFECIVKGNVEMLNGMIYNLIRNAVIHSHGTIMGLQYVTESDRFYTFRFFDNGQGVPDESIGHLFERFYRVDKGRSRKLGDTGLGLTIVHSTIVAHGGAVSVKNRSQGGLEFIFTLEKWSAGR